MTNDADKAKMETERVEINRLAELIIADEENHKTNGKPRRFPDPAAEAESGAPPLDMLTPLGKRLGECTKAEVRVLGEAYLAVARHHHTRAELLERELARRDLNQTP